MNWTTYRRVRPLRSLLALAFLPWLAASAEEAHRAHGPHEHGAAELHVVVEGKALYIELHVPAMNVVGFEHEANDDEQRQAVIAVEAVLERTAAILTPTPDAQCSPVQAHVSLEMLSHDHEGKEHEAEHEKEAGDAGGKEHEHGEVEGGHSEVHAEYELNCANPDRLEEVRIHLFEHYPGIQRIDAEIIGIGGQAAATLTPETPVLPLPR